MSLRPIRIDGVIAYVPLTRGLEAIIDAADAPLVAAYNWYASKDHNTHYALRRSRLSDGERGRPILMHRVLFSAEPGFYVDHINRNGLDNRRSNLRQASNAQNQCNSRLRTDNKTGIKGVSWSKKERTWRAQYCFSGKKYHLGGFGTVDAAKAAYDAAISTHYGEFATHAPPSAP